jgi:predicted ATP-grasp superfamily ATP-dependent carboligase
MDRSSDGTIKTIEKKISILIIDDNVVPLTLAVVRCLGVMGNADIHVLELDNLYLPSFRISKYVKSFTRGEPVGDDQVFDLVKETCIKVKADIIIPIKEKTVRIIAERVDKFLEFTHVPPMPVPQTLEIVRNKWLLYNWLFDNKLSTDRPCRYTDIIRAGKMTQELTFPLLIKPFWGSGGKGIVFIKDQKELLGFRPQCNANSEELLIQNYFPGYNIDINLLAENGKIVAYSIQKDISKGKRLTYSKSIEFVKNENLLEFTSLIIKKLNYNGIAHLDFRYDEHENKLRLIDFNARYWSSLLGSLNTGINFPWLHCLKAWNREIVRTDYRTEKYFMTNNPVKMWAKNISINQAEIKYNLQDPWSFLLNILQSVIYHLKRFTGQTK